MSTSEDRSSWNAPLDDPFRTAILYNSFPPGDDLKCGHWVQLDRMVQQLQRSGGQAAGAYCPFCGASVAYITDGHRSSGTTSSDTKDSSVLFKYGKQVLRLSVVPVDEAMSSWRRRISTLLYWPPLTAQGRIAQVLRLDAVQGMKILYKGKVLYPSKTLDDYQMSKLLLEASKDFDRPAKASQHMLLVMGTPQLGLYQQQSLSSLARSFLVQSFQWVLGMFWYLGRNAISLLLLGRPKE